MGEDLFSKSFDHLLAFVLPGIAVLWGISYFDPMGLGALFRESAKADTSLGGFLFLVLAALGLGVFTSGVRWMLFEKLIPLFPSPPRFNEVNRRDEGVREAYADARHNHFYYYLFYANMMCSVPVVFVGWKWTALPAPPWSKFVWAVVGFVAVELVLFFSARHAISRFKTKAEGILGVIRGGGPDDERRLAAKRQR